MASHSTMLYLSLLGVIFVFGTPQAQGRVVSFHTPTYLKPKLVLGTTFSSENLFSVASNEPAPVHEEHDEPPAPDTRARTNIKPLRTQEGFRPSFSTFPNQSPTTSPDVVQVLNAVIPNAPSRIVTRPPSESLPVRVIQPFSIDPISGEPLKQVSPKFRAFVSPTVSPVPVENPITFDRDFGGSPIVDIESGPNEANSQSQTVSNFENSGSSLSSSLLENSGIPSFQSSTSSLGSSQSFSTLQPISSTSNGFTQLRTSTGGESSVSVVSSSQVLPGTSSSFTSTIYH